MSRIIAIAGKGGTGKTTLAALMIRALIEEGGAAVLAIDADPNSTLGHMLGVKAPSTIVEVIDDISKNPDKVPSGMTKDRYIGLRVQEILNEEKGFDLLSMGRPEGPGCYCFANNMLREILKKLMNNYAYVIIDNEAGMEHLSRRLVRKMNSLLIISDSSIMGIRSARRISDLTDELEIKIKEKRLVLNKLRNSPDALTTEIEKTGLALKTTIPFNEEIEDAAIRDKSIFALSGNNPAFVSARKLIISDLVSKEL